MANDEAMDLGMIEHGFKFPIDADRPLRSKAAGSIRESRFSSEHYNMHWVVIEQIMSICTGGVQRMYRCRGVKHGGHLTNIIEIHEHELERAEPFPDEQEKETDDD